MRANHFDREIAEALASIGVLNVGFGVESGNEEILERIGKDLTLQQFREAFEVAREFGFETWGFFMLGLPGETIDTMEDTLRFARELDPDFAKFLILKPYPGTPVFKELDAAGRIDDRDWSHYGTYAAPVHSLPDLSKADIAAFQRRAYRAFYLQPRKVLQHARRMKSMDQLRANVRSAGFAARLLLRS